MAIVTREEVKQILDIEDETEDGRIDVLIPLVEEHYREIRNAPFETDDDDNIVYPRGARLTAALMIGYQLHASRNSGGMQSESLGDYSYSRAEGADEYPPQVIGSIRRFVRAT